MSTSNKYENGKIYRIQSNQTDQIYIGSTVESLCNRFAGHRSNFRDYKNGKHEWRSSFSIIEKGDAIIRLLESFPCNTRNELRAREQYWIDRSENNVCNDRNAFGEDLKRMKETKKKYYSENRDERIKAASIHNQKPEIKEKRKQKVYCEYCDVSIGYPDVAAHRRAKYHCTNVENAQEVIATNGEHWHQWWLYFDNITKQKNQTTKLKC